MKINSIKTGVVLLMCLIFFPVMAFSAFNVTTSFDMDRDGDVDGKDLGVIAKTNGLAHADAFSANFGEVLDASPTILTPTVMIINFDPILENHDDARLTEYLGWNEVGPLVEQFIQDIKISSGGHINYIVVENYEVDAIPIKQDNFQYTDETYLNCLNSGGSACHDPDAANYNTILADFDVCNKLNNGEIDEVWLFGGPWFGYYESRLAGPGAFWYNAPALEGTSCDRLLPIMGFNYERGNAEMLHSFGHRAESSMTKVFGSWDVNRAPLHDWDLYGHNKGQTSTSSDIFQCGTVHFPPNGIVDYDYSNSAYVESGCDDWDNYPDLTGSTEVINCDEWDCNHYSYMKWWLAHLPQKEGYYDGKLLNWWEYIVGNRFDEVYPRVIGFSSEYAPGWADHVLDGLKGICNQYEWATAGQSTGWVKVLVKNNISSISIYDRACPEQVSSGHIEFDNGRVVSFGPLEDSGNVATVLNVNEADVEWIKVYIDTSLNGANPGIGEVVFSYF